MVLKPGKEDVARRIFEKWQLDIAVIGTITDTGRMVVRHKGVMVADLPLDSLNDDAPLYERPYEFTKPPKPFDTSKAKAPDNCAETLLQMVGSPALSSRRWIYEQYDHTIMGDTLQRPGGDAGVVRVHGTNTALAVTVDVTPRYCHADPKEGCKQAVVETWRNLVATGAKPLAITDCMNFGNPERPEIMGQFAGCILGMKEACEALDYPVVSGNVSLYNETNGTGILPTPGIGGVGLIEDARIYARTDVRRGVHKAPANEVIRGIVTTDINAMRKPLEFTFGKREQDILNPKNVNVIRDFRAESPGPDWDGVFVALRK